MKAVKMPRAASAFQKYIRHPLEAAAVLMVWGVFSVMPVDTASAVGGWIARTDKDGKSFELYSAGFRNQYDIAFNADHFQS